VPPPAHRIRAARRFVACAVALSLACTGLLLSVPLTAAATVGSTQCSSTPFRSSPANHRWFRIPAIVQTSAGTLVAFAERRDNNNTSDTGNFDIVTARSTNHGCSWSAYQVVGSDAANRVSTPVPILDATTGAVLLFSVVTPRPGSGGHGKGPYLQTSTDDGRTFSPLLSHPVRPDGGFKAGLTGPGHGIQLTVTHPGRLILPMGYKTAAGLYGASGIYSDDHGTTWHNGFDERDSTGKVKFLEGTIAELPSGKLFISFRLLHDGAKAGTARKYAVSADGGKSLTGPFRTSSLKIVSVQGSALAPTGTYGGELLFSAPAVPTPNLRRDMSIFVSTTGGATGKTRDQVELEDTPGAYSDLVQLDAGSIGVLYETGIATWKERIGFESIEIAALTHPAMVGSQLSYQRSKHPTTTSGRAKVTVSVTVKGIRSPPGRVTLSYARAGTTRTAAVQLTYSNRGTRAIVLPKLKKGNYHLTLTYSGTGRIGSRTKSAGTLQVVSG
jgi:sialidase-1